MKICIYFLAFAGLIGTATAQIPHYEITGKIEGAEGVTFILRKNVNGKIINVNSATVTDGILKIIGGKVEYPEQVNLVTLNKKMEIEKVLSFYLENTNISITGNLDSLGKAKITGSKTQDEFRSYLDSLTPLNRKYAELNKKYQNVNLLGNLKKSSQIQIQLDSLENDMIKVQKDFVKNNPASFAAASVIGSMINYLKPSEIESYLNALDANVAKTIKIKELKERVAILKKVEIGQKATDFTLNDPDGKPVSLSSKIGPKLLLIDFWAAWCGPCRAENPNIVKLYKEFKSEGFDILGVSLDQVKADWLEAIADDKLTWTHVSDLQFWNSAAAKLYSVNSIPANFLLDNNGIIVAKNLRGEALYSKVKELLNTK